MEEEKEEDEGKDEESRAEVFEKVKRGGERERQGPARPE